MHLEYIEQSATSLFFMAYVDDSLQKQIGAGEGYIGNDQQLTFVVKVYDGFGQQGNGYAIFKEIVHHFSNFEPILTINGSWSKDPEFSYVEGGQSTNLTVFNALIESGLSKEDAALNTPTGKWAVKLGYSQVTVLSAGRDKVSVAFTR